ncbi:hypothetical protein OIU76_013144, partial [Salix suchowensis]
MMRAPIIFKPPPTNQSKTKATKIYRELWFQFDQLMREILQALKLKFYQRYNLQFIELTKASQTLLIALHGRKDHMLSLR